MRLIDADALLKALKANCGTLCNDKNTDWCEYCCPHNDFEDLIDNAPTVEPELSDEQIEKITDLLETEWGYEGIREDVSRILRGKEE